MAARYANELTRLSRTLAWAATSDLAPLRQAISAATHSSLRAVGSGGSLTAAHVLATLHKRYSGYLAAATTPLEAINQPLDPSISAWLLTAGGSNVDILSVAKALIAGEPRQLAVLCGRRNSPLARLCGQHPFIDLLLYAPHGRDGFLATNSLLGFSSILARAYAAEYRREDDWHDAHQQLLPLVRSDSSQISAWQDATQPLWRRATTLVLHGASTHTGAIDLESKFTESALGNVQLADYRNFAHGRHHWLAKHADTSAILAFVADDDRRVAERTLNLIPPEIPQARISLPGGPTATELSSLTVALWVTQWAATARGVDPGRPGVPEFGRKIYHLRAQGRRRRVPLSPRQSAAIRRKNDLAGINRDDPTNLGLWREALEVFLLRLRNSRFNAVVFDYDGTLMDTRHRFATPTPEICAELVRLIESNASIGIATGRGKSVRDHLQRSLPQSLWSRVLVGYYNGAQLAPLNDDATPDVSPPVDPSLEPLVDPLLKHSTLSRIARQTTRPWQITLSTMSHVSNDLVWELTSEIVHEARAAAVSVVRSAHSVDVLAAGVDKLNVVDHLRQTTGDHRVLTIGDRGRWPGNDHKLLCEPCSLSVDEVSTDPSTCWHLGHSGQRGLAVTLDYLAALTPSAGHLAFAPDAFE